MGTDQETVKCWKKSIHFYAKFNTYDLLVATLSIGIPSIYFCVCYLIIFTFLLSPNMQGPKPIRATLPSMVPNFIGRQSEVEEIIGHVTSESTRMVSIWGSPGFGKTSVAIAVGHALQSQGLPVYWVSSRGPVSYTHLTLPTKRIV